jgi:hypothetical protein
MKTPGCAGVVWGDDRDWRREVWSWPSGKAGRVTPQNAGAAANPALEDKLEALESGRPEIRTEILKPVFTNVCVSDEFIRMYNATVDNTERTLIRKT